MLDLTPALREALADFAAGKKIHDELMTALSVAGCIQRIPAITREGRMVLEADGTIPRVWDFDV